MHNPKGNGTPQSLDTLDFTQGNTQGAETLNPQFGDVSRSLFSQLVVGCLAQTTQQLFLLLKGCR